MLVSGFNMPSGDELKALIESMEDGDALTEAVKQLGKEFPSLLAPLIHERDAYMVAKLRDVAHRNGISSARPCRKIVAVVGAGHCEGMEEFIAVPWDHPSDTEALMAAMEEVPDPKDWERSRRAIALSVGLTLAGSIAGTVYVVSVFARRRR
jgi:pheromone shutdown protein TraB